jgi:hypothetical protein
MLVRKGSRPCGDDPSRTIPRLPADACLTAAAARLLRALLARATSGFHPKRQTRFPAMAEPGSGGKMRQRVGELHTIVSTKNRSTKISADPSARLYRGQ